MSYTVYVDDNYNYMDESSRYRIGEFQTYQAAVAAAKKLVDAFLLEHYKPGTTAEELFSGYRGYGGRGTRKRIRNFFCLGICRATL